MNKTNKIQNSFCRNYLLSTIESLQELEDKLSKEKEEIHKLYLHEDFLGEEYDYITEQLTKLQKDFSNLSLHLNYKLGLINESNCNNALFIREEMAAFSNLMLESSNITSKITKIKRVKLKYQKYNPDVILRTDNKTSKDAKLYRTGFNETSRTFLPENYQELLQKKYLEKIPSTKLAKWSEKLINVSYPCKWNVCSINSEMLSKISREGMYTLLINYENPAENEGNPQTLTYLKKIPYVKLTLLSSENYFPVDKLVSVLEGNFNFYFYATVGNKAEVYGEVKTSNVFTKALSDPFFFNKARLKMFNLELFHYLENAFIKDKVSSLVCFTTNLTLFQVEILKLRIEEMNLIKREFCRMIFNFNHKHNQEVFYK